MAYTLYITQNNWCQLTDDQHFARMAELVDAPDSKLNLK